MIGSITESNWQISDWLQWERVIIEDMTSSLFDVSVLICSYNDGETLARSIESALAEPITQLVIVDDGSTDTSPVVIAQYAHDTRVTVATNETNLGLPQACNVGISAISCEFVVRLDADDYFSPGIISTLMAPLSDPVTDLVVGDYWERTSDEKPIRKITVDPGDIYTFVACGVVMRTLILRECGGYRDVFWEEYDLFIRYLQVSGSRPVKIDFAGYNYTKHDSSMTADAKRSEAGWREFASIWPRDIAAQFGSPPSELYLD
jgi:glycosyltransferase involved in cell wall biosynthesis